MAFRFAARTLLELGKELISSDEVALYELIKNAIDARSHSVSINAKIVIQHSTYVEAIDSLDNDVSPEATIEFICSRILPGISRTQIDSFIKPMKQSVNDRDAFRKKLIAQYRRCNWIKIVDTGHGMSLKELDTVFLTVGTRSRRAENIGGAEYLGDKGVGRLSTMRLGDYLTVTTSRANETTWNKLKVNWSLFSHESEAEVGDINIEPVPGEPKEEPSMQGTTIRINSLHTDWDETYFTELFQGKIARMVDPFEAGRGNKLLQVYFNGNRIFIPSIPKQLLKTAHATCMAELKFEDNKAILKGLIDYRLRQKKLTVHQEGTEVLSIAQKVVKRRGKRGHAATETKPIPEKALKELGPFKVEIYWFNRRIAEAIEGLTDKSQETKDEIARWSGGPMLFRHGFRILPYGDPDDDWLELDTRAFGASGFKLNRQQVIGRVLVRTPHTSLSEQTNREGLVQSSAADALKALLMWILHSEMRRLINNADEVEKLNQRTAEFTAFDFKETQNLVTNSLNELRSRVEHDHISFIDKLTANVETLGNQCEEFVVKTRSLVKEMKKDREKFVHLAAIGLSSEFIFHELDRSVSHSLQALANAKGSNKESVLQSLEDQLITLQKRVSAFDEFTGARRQTKSIVDVGDVIQTVINNHANRFVRHNIGVHFNASKKPFKIKAVRGMLIQILDNLVANSTYWMKQQKEYEAGFEPAIYFDLDAETKTITVEDNGPGVYPERRELIFQPFVTSKPAKEGRGLGLFISRELAEYHGWKIYLDKEAGRMRPERLSLFVLEVGS